MPISPGCWGPPPGDRSPRAERFAKAQGVERSYGDYRALVGDPGVDVVYVATPHPMHVRDATLALDAGKRVLVEKPLALDAGPPRFRGRGRGRRVRHGGAVDRLPAQVRCGQAARAERGRGRRADRLLDHREWFADSHRILRPERAGGSLLDLASYTAAVAPCHSGATPPPAGFLAPASTHQRAAAGLMGVERLAQAGVVPGPGYVAYHDPAPGRTPPAPGHGAGAPLGGDQPVEGRCGGIDDRSP